MNRNKISIVLGTILILMHGFSTGAWSEPNHSAGGPSSENRPAPGRDTVGSAPTDISKVLIDALQNEKLFKAHVVPLGKENPESVTVNTGDAEKLLKWAKTFDAYHKGL